MKKFDKKMEERRRRFEQEMEELARKKEEEERKLSAATIEKMTVTAKETIESFIRENVDRLEDYRFRKRDLADPLRDILDRILPEAREDDDWDDEDGGSDTRTGRPSASEADRGGNPDKGEGVSGSGNPGSGDEDTSSGGSSPATDGAADKGADNGADDGADGTDGGAGEDGKRDLKSIFG